MRSVPMLWMFFVAVGCDSARQDTAQSEPVTESAAPGLFQKGGPTIPDALKGMQFGTPGKDAAGVLLRSNITGQGIIGDGLKVVFDSTSDRVTGYVVEVSEKELSLLNQLWGRPTIVGKHKMWFNEKLGLRVRQVVDPVITALKNGVAKVVGISDRVKEFELIYEPYLAYETLLGPGTKLAFLPHPIVGRTVAQVKASYPQNFSRDEAMRDVELGELQFPGTEYTLPLIDSMSSQTRVALEGDQDGKIVSFSFSIGYQDAAGKKKILAVLAKKFGEPKPTRIDGSLSSAIPPLGETLQYGPIDNRTITVGKPISGEALVIEVK